MRFPNIMRGFATKSKRLMIQYAYGHEHESLLAMTRKAHADYCGRHGIEYLVAGGPAGGGRTPHWRKVELLAEAVNADYERVAWLDTDCVIVDPTYDLFDASGYGVAVCECWDSPVEERHLNAGFLLATNSPPVKDFFRDWLAMPPGGKWEDQSAFIALMAGHPHRDILTILPNRFNCLSIHMEAREPIIRAFHGDGDRFGKIAELVSNASR